MPACGETVADQNPSSIDHDGLRHVFDEVVWRKGFKPFPLGYDDAAVRTRQTARIEFAQD
jgi:hypothetical protein